LKIGRLESPVPVGLEVIRIAHEKTPVIGGSK
jgi:hypothetical protein